MPELIYNEAEDAWQYRQMLRSPYIDYFNGRFFVTFQVCHNKAAAMGGAGVQGNLS